jgi:hypothetical protein
MFRYKFGTAKKMITGKMENIVGNGMETVIYWIKKICFTSI